MALKAPSLLEAARAAGLSVSKETQPEDKFITLGKFRFHYLDWGSEGKPYMLLLHSNMQTLHTWDFFALTRCQEYHVLAMDLRGHGDSDWDPEANYGLPYYLQDLESFIEALKLPPTILIGNAMGGMIFMAYAANHPEKARALVMVDSAIVGEPEGGAAIRGFVQGPDELDSLEAFVERAYQFNPRRSREQYMGSLQHSIKQMPNGKWTWKYDKVFRDPNRRRAPSHTSEQLWELAAKIKCPTLIFRGAESKSVSIATMERLRDTIAGSRFINVEGAGHMVMGDKPVEFDTHVREFLNHLPKLKG